MLYRGSSRDLFDVYRIVQLHIDTDTFRVCAVVDSLMRGPSMLHEVDINDTIERIPVDTGLLNLLRRGSNDFSKDKAKRQALEFSKGILSGLTPDQRKAINQFHEEKTFSPKLIDKKGILNPGIRTHPMILHAHAK